MSERPSAVHLLDVESVAAELADLSPRPMFFGASILPLYLDGEAFDDPRPTDDIDLVLVLTGDDALRAEATVEAALVARGWAHDLHPRRKNRHAFLSRGEIPVDVVMLGIPPSYEANQAETNPHVESWPLYAAMQPAQIQLRNGCLVCVPTPAQYLACKIAASRVPARWSGPYESDDIEDIAQLLVGCSAIPASAANAPAALAHYLRQWATELLAGETAYGGAAYELLVGNLPRSSRLADLTAVLDALAQLDLAPSTQ